MISSFVRSSFLARFYSDRSGLDRSLLLSCGFSMLLLLTRVLYTGNLMFCFLIWNLFLAYLPYKISGGLMRHPQWIEHKWKFGLFVGAWLLLLPNTFYIITDLFHLESGGALPVWFDLARRILAWSQGWYSCASLKKMKE